MKRNFAIFLLCAAAVSAEPATSDPKSRNTMMLQAIRSGDMGRMKAALDSGADANAMDEDGTPAVMNAVLYGGPQALKLLLDRGANANAKNAGGATALIWGGGDPEKARLLLAAGADVNVASALGRTPLHAAASVAGGAPIVKMMLEKGAKADVYDKLGGIPVIFTGGGKGTPLIDAARVGDADSMIRLLRAGADVNATDGRGATALTEAVVNGRRDVVKMLLENHAKPNLTVTVLRFPILSLAAIRGDVEVARMLVQAGAEVNASDVSGTTPLMWAALTDHVNPALVQLFIKSGADVKALNKAGESALDVANTRGMTRVVRILRDAGAPQKDAVAYNALPRAESEVPLEQTLALLSKAGDVGAKKTGCASCHNNSLPLVAFALASRKGVAVDEGMKNKSKAMLLGMIKPFVPAMLEGSAVTPDLQVTGGYFLEALSAQGHAPDQMTAAIVHNIAGQQTADGRWNGVIPRAPVENGDIQATALSIRSIRLYPIPGRRDELEQRVAHAGRWLRTAQPATTEEHIMRMLGLKWAGMDSREVQDAARQLVALQRKDGGWGQLPTLPTDAYATAKAVYALQEVSGVNADALAVHNGVKYLRETQLADGTWYVKTRSFPFQPLIATGFPHGRDEWMSITATGWAAIVLLQQMPQTL